MSDTEMLSMIEAVIRERLTGQAVEGVSEQGNQYRGTPLKELFQIRNNLRESIAAAQGGHFGLAEMTSPVDYITGSPQR
jgi:hypothetical protein